MTDLINCAIYGRYSSDMQKETSIEDQIHNCRVFAATRNWKILEEHIYYDKALSGTSIFPRDGFNKLLDVALSGSSPFEYILVDDTSRVARNTREALQIFEDLSFKNIFVYYISQGIDTQKEIASEMITLHGMVDALYIKELAKKVHRGLAGQIQRGYSAGGRAYGYKSLPVMGEKLDRYGNPIPIGYKQVIDAEQAKTVISIFEQYAVRHYSYNKIVNLLNKSYIETGSPKPPRRKLWGITSIAGQRKRHQGILNNTIYIGKRIWNMRSSKRNPRTGKITKIINPPHMWVAKDMPELRIISDDLWKKTRLRQREIEDRIGDRFTKAKALYAPNLLTRLSICAVCGGTFGIVFSGNNKGYGCTAKKRLGKHACNNKVKIRKQFFEESVVYIFCEFVSNKDELTRLTKETNNNFTAYFALLQQNIGKVEILKQIEETRKEIHNISNAITAGIITETTKTLLLKAEQKEKNLLNQKSLIETNKLPILSNLVMYDDMNAYFKNVSNKLLDPDTMKETLYSAIDKIIVGCNVKDEITIEIHEKINNTISYIYKLINRRELGIRLETGTQFQPYSRRIIRYRLIETSHCRGTKKNYTIIKE